MILRYKLLAFINKLHNNCIFSVYFLFLFDKDLHNFFLYYFLTSFYLNLVPIFPSPLIKNFLHINLINPILLDFFNSTILQHKQISTWISLFINNAIGSPSLKKNVSGINTSMPLKIILWVGRTNLFNNHS